VTQSRMRPVDLPPATPAEPWWRRTALVALLVGLALGVVADAAGFTFWQKNVIVIPIVIVFVVWSWRRDVARRRPPQA